MLFVLFAGFIGCEKNEALPIFPEAGENDLVIAVLEPSEGALEIAAFLVKDPPPAITKSAGAKLHFFLAAEGDLRGLDGATFATGLAARVQIVDAAEPGGACDRCNGATLSAPQLLYDGDRCGLPAFFSYSGDGDAAAIAQRLRLTVSGDCACERYREDPAGELPSISLYDLEGDVWPHDAAAVTANGTAGLFGEHHSVTIAPDGARTVADAATSPFDGIGTPLTATGTREQTFWVNALRNDDQNSTLVLDARMNLIAHDLPAELSTQRVRALDDGRVLVLGKINRAARAFVCNSTAPTLCRSIIPAIELLGVTYTDAAIAADGTIILAGFSGLLFLDGLPSAGVPDTACTFGQRECSGELPGGAHYRAVALPEDLRHLDFVQSIAVAGSDRLLVCTHGLGGELLSVALQPGMVTGSDTLVFEDLASRSEQCGRFARTADGAQRMVFASTASLLIPARGPAVEETPSNLRGAETNFDHLISWTGESPREVFVDGVRVYGDPALEEARFANLIPDRDRVLGLRTDGKIDLITEFQKANAALVLQPGESVTAGAIDRGDGSLLVGLFGPNGPMLARTGGSELGALERLDRGALSGVVTAIESVAPGMFAVATSERSLWVLDGSTLTRAEVEEGCELDRAGVAFTEISAVAGRAWITGTLGVFLELNPFADPPRARCIALTRETQTHAPEGTRPLISGVLGVCADDVLVGAPADSMNEARNARGAIWELTSAKTCADPELDRCVLDADNILAGTKVIAGAPVLAGDRRVVTAAFRGASWHGGTIIRLGVAGQYRFPEQILHAVRAPWGDFYYGTLFGRVLRGRL